VAEFPITPDELKRLAHLVEESGLSELRYERGNLRVTLRTAAFRQEGAVAPAPLTAAAAPASAVDALDALEEDASHTDEADTTLGHASVDTAGHLRIEAPIMGVFYRKPSPEEPPFVEVGDVIEAGHVVGMIEAMKVFSEVPSEVAGRVVDVPAKHGGLVQPGDALVVLEAMD
jgi:acetyl-CoA carboxylase biotin carboxyl carrier protein